MALFKQIFYCSIYLIVFLPVSSFLKHLIKPNIIRISGLFAIYIYILYSRFALFKCAAYTIKDMKELYLYYTVTIAIEAPLKPASNETGEAYVKIH